MTTETISINRDKNAKIILDLQTEIFGDTLDTSKTGLQGFLNDTMSELATQVTTTSVLRQDERFLNTTRLETSTNLIASTFNYPSLTIVPSEIKVIVDIKLLLEDNENTSIKIPADTAFFFNNKQFILPGEILLSRSGTNWFVKLNDNVNYERNIGDLVSNSYDSEDGTKIISFITDLKQINKSTSIYTIPVRQRLELQKIDIDIPSNLVDISITITDPVTQIKRSLIKVTDNFNNFVDEDTKNKEIFLLKNGSNGYELWLEGGSRTKFVPSGQDLEITLFSSDGYIGILNKPTFSVRVPDSLSPRDITCYSLTQGSEGVSKLGLRDQKVDIIRHIQTPFFETIVTEFDMENITKKYMDLEDKDFCLIIRRNDPVVRIIDFFVKLKNEREEILRTNSLNIELTENNFIDDIFISPSDYYKNNILNSKTMEKSIEDNSLLLDDSENKYFISPYFHKGLSNPLRVESYILNRNNFFEDIIQKQIVNQPLPKSFFPIILKGIFSQDSLTSEVKLTYSATFTSSNKDLMNIDLAANKIEVYLVFKNQDGTNVGYNRLTKDIENNFLFSKEFTPILNNTSEEKFLFKEMVLFDTGTNFNSVFEAMNDLEPDVDLATKLTLAEFPTKLDLDFKIEIFAFSNELLVTGNKEIYMSDITLKNTQLCKYETKNYTQVFRSATNTCNILVKKEDPLVDNLFLGQIPMVSVKDFLDDNLDYNQDKRDYILNQINKLENLSKSLFSRLEAPSIPAFKYINSYGFIEDYYNTDSVNLKFTIEISASSMQNESELRSNIKKIIVEAVNESRNKYDGNIYLSHLIDRALTVTGITQVRILNYSDNIYAKRAEMVKTLNRVQLKTYVPALLNVREEDITVILK